MAVANKGEIELSEETKFFRSKKPNHCSKCGQSIRLGQWIGWNRSQRGVAWHWDCSQADAAPPYDRQYHRSTSVAPTIPTNPLAPLPAVTPEVVEDEQLDDSGKPATPLASDGVAPTLPTPVAGDGLGSFATMLIPYLDGKISAKSDSGIEQYRTTLRQEFDAAVAKLRDQMTVVVKVEKPSGEIATVKGAHELFPKLLKLVSMRLWAYLHGPAGSFKSTAAKMAADANDLPFESISLNVQTFESRLIGFVDPFGIYHDTGLRRCFEKGGVFLIDEIDNASGNLLTTINMLLANGHFTFPDKAVDRHPDFVCIATGNTSGRGASRQHSERRQLDSATLDRFVSVPWDYDWKLTRQLAKDINPDCDKWIDWVIAANNYCRRDMPMVLCTPRSCFSGAKLLTDSIFSYADIAEMTVFKGLDKDSVAKIVAANPLPTMVRS